MSELPYDLQNENTDTDSGAPEPARSRLLIGGFIALLQLVVLCVVAFVLYKAFDTSRRLSTVEALPLAKLEGYTTFSEETKAATRDLNLHLGSIEKRLVINEGRLDQIEEASNQASINFNDSRTRIDALEQRLNSLADTLAKQQKSAASLQKKIAQSRSPSATAPAVQLLSVRSFGNIPAIRLTSKTGEISPLMRTGDQWNGWRFMRLEGDKVIFSIHGKEQALVL